MGEYGIKQIKITLERDGELSDYDINWLIARVETAAKLEVEPADQHLKGRDSDYLAGWEDAVTQYRVAIRGLKDV